jgi:hypothetical protein
VSDTFEVADLPVVIPCGQAKTWDAQPNGGPTPLAVQDDPLVCPNVRCPVGNSKRQVRIRPSHLRDSQCVKRHVEAERDKPARTVYLMAKAALTAPEAVVENAQD